MLPEWHSGIVAEVTFPGRTLKTILDKLAAAADQKDDTDAESQLH